MASGALEGRLRVGVRWDGERIRAIELASTRPVDACRVLEGRPADEVVALVPRLFSLCGRAQAAAAGAALEAAGALPESVPAWHRVAAEALLESLWRLLHDLPHALDEAPLLERLAPLRQLLLSVIDGRAAGGELGAAVQTLRALLAEQVLGPDPEAPGAGLDALARWLATPPTPVAAWLARLDAGGLGDWGRSATPLMPARPGEEALRQLAARLRDEPRFAHRPDWNGRPVETGALALRQDEPLLRQLRQVRGHDVMTRLVARLVDVRRLAEGLVGDAAPPPLLGSLPLGPGAGLGWVQTARGLLLHRVECDGSRVTAYRVLAPTEWNFHPAGALACGLEAQPAANEAALRRGVTLAVLALDPCVGFELALDDVATAPAGS